MEAFQGSECRQSRWNERLPSNEGEKRSQAVVSLRPLTVSEALNLAGEVPKNRVHCHPEQAVLKEVREEPLAVSVFSGWVATVNPLFGLTVGS